MLALARVDVDKPAIRLRGGTVFAPMAADAGTTTNDKLGASALYRPIREAPSNLQFTKRLRFPPQKWPAIAVRSGDRPGFSLNREDVQPPESVKSDDAVRTCRNRSEWHIP